MAWKDQDLKVLSSDVVNSFWYKAPNERLETTVYQLLRQEERIRVHVDIPKGCSSEKFYSEGSLFRKDLSRRVIIPKIFILKDRYSELRDKKSSQWRSIKIKNFAIITVQNKTFRNENSYDPSEYWAVPMHEYRPIAPDPDWSNSDPLTNSHGMDIKNWILCSFQHNSNPI